jgi:hypothetical protein
MRVTHKHAFPPTKIKLHSFIMSLSSSSFHMPKREVWAILKNPCQKHEKKEKKWTQKCLNIRTMGT